MATEAYCCSIAVRKYINFKLAELSTESTAINVTCNYENLVSMETEIYVHRFAVDACKPYIWNIYRNLVALATEKYFYNSGI